MITIDLQRGNRVAPEEHKNSYQLTVNYMHGDADGDTSHTSFYTPDQVDELKIDILGVITAANSGDNLDDCRDVIAAIFESQGIEDAHDRADEWSDNFWEGDITNEGTGACCTGYDLFYWDADGIQFEVNTFVNGKKLA